MTIGKMAHPKVVLTCTDRGQHTLATLGSAMSVNRGEDLRANEWVGLDKIGERLRDELVRIDAHGRLCVKCNRCGRNPQWRRETAHSLIIEASDAGLMMIDVSLIS
jgi:hypothetical protein